MGLGGVSADGASGSCGMAASSGVASAGLVRGWSRNSSLGGPFHGVILGGTSQSSILNLFLSGLLIIITCNPVINSFLLKLAKYFLLSAPTSFRSWLRCPDPAKRWSLPLYASHSPVSPDTSRLTTPFLSEPGPQYISQQ